MGLPGTPRRRALAGSAAVDAEVERIYRNAEYVNFDSPRALIVHLVTIGYKARIEVDQ